MEKGVRRGGGGLWWNLCGLLALLGAVTVGAIVGYLEAGRRSEMLLIKTRIHMLEDEMMLLRNQTVLLQAQIVAQEKRLEEEKSSQYYDENTDYYDDDSYDDYRDEEEAAGGGGDGASVVSGGGGAKNRTRRSLLEELLSGRRRRAVGQGGDRYNLIITQGPKRPPPPRLSGVEAVVLIDPKKGRTVSEHVQHPGAFARPYTPPPSPYDRRSRVLNTNRWSHSTPSYQEHAFKEEVLRHGGGRLGNAREDVDDFGDSNCCTSIAVQYGSDTTRYRKGHDHHYDGNHRLYHPEGLFKDWTQYTWGIDYDSHFSMQNGHLTVYIPGMYYLYAQIFYADPHDTSGYKVYVNGVAKLQCTVTSPSEKERLKRNSCYTGGLVSLQASDKITLREVEGHRYTVFEPTKSYFGLFRVAKI